jgi:hypothetical protein
MRLKLDAVRSEYIDKADRLALAGRPITELGGLEVTNPGDRAS